MSMKSSSVFVSLDGKEDLGDIRGDKNATTQQEKAAEFNFGRVSDVSHTTSGGENKAAMKSLSKEEARSSTQPVKGRTAMQTDGVRYRNAKALTGLTLINWIPQLNGGRHMDTGWSDMASRSTLDALMSVSSLRKPRHHQRAAFNWKVSGHPIVMWCTFYSAFPGLHQPCRTSMKHEKLLPRVIPCLPRQLWI